MYSCIVRGMVPAIQFTDIYSEYNILFAYLFPVSLGWFIYKV